MTGSTASRTSARALARSHSAERTLTFLLGLVAVLAGAAALVVGQGWLGEFRAQRPLLDPMAVSWLAGHQLSARIGAVVLGVLLFVLGLWWFFRSLRPERRPDLALDETPGAELTVTAGALAGAVQTDAETIAGVTRARARAVGTSAEPALRVTLWLSEGTDVRRIWTDLDTYVLARAREALGLDSLPTAVRLELDTTGPARVR
ncbi:alkaline shock response membrane anchor protein AmaP [Amycolatopsis sp. DSM 110486]|uniref:alkaline shock response membrane anchor protein AmaP n=1 Tax=Amycolatopsis sp. DSM 110486 TaxID=2865832 RepID=UPI001C6A34B6|nr:alkaline shock response membrane anchor protein AmaP [Amycolatopsis sp. DSM 110486]QYN17341.1 alkaline shock response membrane anchor protein AmaP [Amycolatopsis sp. DSM 110486]